MGFTLTLHFEGLLHYVANDLTGTAKDVRLCVVLPKAAQHTGSVYSLNGTQLVGADPGGVAIDGQRAVIKFTPSGSNFDFETTVIGGSRKLKGAVHLDGIIGSHADKNAAIVAPVPPRTLVRSQVLIGSGGKFILNNNNPSPPELILPPTSLNGYVTTSIDFGDFYMEANVDQAWLLILPLVDSVTPDAVYPIKPGSDRNADIVLSHICSTTSVSTPPIPDDDFRFHYMLLAALPVSTLKDMPVPIINKFSGASKSFLPPDAKIIKPDGCDCAGARAASRSYDLDKFLNVPIPSANSAGQ